MSGLVLQRLEVDEYYRPLELLSEHIHEWAEREVTPMAVVRALGYLAGRELKPFEERDTIAWMNDGIIGRNRSQGEL